MSQSVSIEHPSMLPEISRILPSPEKPAVKCVNKQTPISILKSISNPEAYADRTITFTRHVINSIIYSGSKISGKVIRSLKTTSSSLKALHFINIPGCLKEFPERIKALGQNIHRKDHEGILFASLAMSYAVADLLDNVATTAVAICDLASRVVGFLKLIGTPIALAAIAVKVTLTTLHLFHLMKFKHEFNKDVLKKIENKDISSEDLRNIVKKFLEKHLDPKSPADSNKIRSLERHTNGFTLSKLQKLEEIIKGKEELSDSDRTDVLDIVKDIKKSLEIERNCEVGSLLTALTSGVCYSLFLTPVAPLAPFMVLTINCVAQLTLMTYKDKHKDYRLKCA